MYLDNRAYIIKQIRDIIVEQIQLNGIEYKDNIEDILNYVAKEISSKDFKDQVEVFLTLMNPITTAKKESMREKEKEYHRKRAIDLGIK